MIIELKKDFKIKPLACVIILKGDRQKTVKSKSSKRLGITRCRRLFFAYPAEDSLSESCDKGGTGEPPLSSDGVLDKNKLPPISETKVMGEL